jgi:hypothetical protein
MSSFGWLEHGLVNANLSPDHGRKSRDLPGTSSIFGGLPEATPF